MTEPSPVQPNLTKMRDDECIPIAREILAIIGAEKDIVIGTSETFTEDKAIEYYNKLYESKIAPLLVEKNVRVKDLTFIFQICQQAIQLLESRATMTVDTRYDQAVAKVMGAEHIDDVRINNIQDVLVDKTADKEKE